MSKRLFRFSGPRFLSLIGMASLAALSTSAVAGGIVWNQLPGASIKDTRAVGGLVTCSYETDYTEIFDESIYSSATSPVDTCSGVGGNGSASSAFNDMSTTGGTISATAAGAAFDPYTTSGGLSRAVAIFDVLDSQGVNVAVNWNWASDGEVPQSQLVEGWLMRIPDGCADANSYGCLGSVLLALEPFPYGSNSPSGNVTQSIFLAPGTYQFYARMDINVAYGHLGQGATARNGSLSASINVVQPIYPEIISSGKIEIDIPKCVPDCPPPPECPPDCPPPPPPDGEVNGIPVEPPVDRGNSWVFRVPLALACTDNGEITLIGKIGNRVVFVGTGVIDPPLPCVAIDVDPFSTANVIKPASNNLIAVAVKGSNVAAGDTLNFDATQVDPASLKLGIGEASNVAVNPFVADFDGDTNTDVAFGFRTQDTGIFCGDTEVTLAGETYAGDPFIGTDTISTTDCVDTGCHP